MNTFNVNLSFLHKINKNRVSSFRPVSEIERCFRKELRIRKQLDASQIIWLIDDDTPFVEIAERLLQSIFNNRLEIVRIHPYVKRKNLFRATSLERELVTGLRSFFEDEDLPELAWPLLATVPEVMLREFACTQKIPWRYEAECPDIRTFIENLNEKHPATKPALKKSFNFLRKNSE